METDDVRLEDIQAGNEAARKKLEGFRSGLERLMNKRAKQIPHHEPPSQDNKTPDNKFYHNYLTQNSANSPSNIKSVQLPQGTQFGFNSTLFRQIPDDTVILSNPSVHRQENASNLAYNSVPKSDYFSVSSKPSINYYEPRIQGDGGESFAKASKLFSEVEDIINKSKKTAKLPVKPIQKYFERIQHNLNLSDVEGSEFNFSKSRIRLDEEIKFSPRKDRNSSEKDRNNEEVKAESKGRSVSAKEQLKSASSFLNHYKGMNELMKAPPLPPAFPREQSSQRQVRQVNQGGKQNIDRWSEQSMVATPNKWTLKKGENSVEMHKTKLQQALSQRKKMMREDGILDDSIELELSDEEAEYQGGNGNVRLCENSKNEQEVRKLQAEKQQLLRELELIQQELQQLEHQ